MGLMCALGLHSKKKVTLVLMPTSRTKDKAFDLLEKSTLARFSFMFPTKMSERCFWVASGWLLGGFVKVIE